MESSSALIDPKVRQLIDTLYLTESRKRTMVASNKCAHPQANNIADCSEQRQIDRNLGNLIYALVRRVKPKTVLEMGNTLSLSTLFLAAGVKDNGFGKIIRSQPSAQQHNETLTHLHLAQLTEVVEWHKPDVTQRSQAHDLNNIDFLLMNGEENDCKDLLQQIEPVMAAKCVIVTDNTDSQKAQSYLDYIRDPHNGYISCALSVIGESPTASRREITLKMA